MCRKHTDTTLPFKCNVLLQIIETMTFEFLTLNTYHLMFPLEVAATTNQIKLSFWNKKSYILHLQSISSFTWCWVFPPSIKHLPRLIRLSRLSDSSCTCPVLVASWAVLTSECPRCGINKIHLIWFLVPLLTFTKPWATWPLRGQLYIEDSWDEGFVWGGGLRLVSCWSGPRSAGRVCKAEVWWDTRDVILRHKIKIKYHFQKLFLSL